MNSNPFYHLASQDSSAFFGRYKELEKIWKKLLSQPPHCVAIIGETSFGKTSLVRYLIDAQTALKNNPGIKPLTFVYLDASPYMELAADDHASAQFLWDMYSELQISLDPTQKPKTAPSLISADQNPEDEAIRIRTQVEQLLQKQDRTIIFVFDNFEGIASLPLHNSAWLRYLARYYNCVYMVTSRHPLQLLYHPEMERWGNVSPLWNLFSDNIYLGLMEEEEINSFIFQGSKLEGFWRKEDNDFIRRMAGRHPEFVRMACALLYEKRHEKLQQSRQLLSSEEIKFLEFMLYRDASPICNQLWRGLADPELLGISRVGGHPKETGELSAPQKVLIDVAIEGNSSKDIKLLFKLEERGLIERVGNKWQVFAEPMRQFVISQAEVWQKSEPITSSTTSRTNRHATQVSIGRHEPDSRSHTQVVIQPALTYLEGKVYEYLQSHAGQVCDKKEIKQAIWKDKSPSDSTLHKIIERIRKKIEPDPDNPRRIISVRGQGYMLREDLTA